MKHYFALILICTVLWINCFSSPIAPVLTYRSEVELNERLDTLNLGTFESLSGIRAFIDEYFSSSGSTQNPLSTFLPKTQKDSLFEFLYQEKRVIIPSTDLPIFYDFVLPEQAAETRINQRLILLPKDKELRFELQVNEGDTFLFQFRTDKGFLNGSSIEILNNSVQVSEELKLESNSLQSFDFVADQEGTVELIFRNFGFFKLEGEITVQVKPRNLKVKLGEFNKLDSNSKELLVTVRDTVFKTLFNGPLVLSNMLNLRDNPIFNKELNFDSTQNLLGFAVFIFPTNQKNQLEVQRRSIIREEPLQDFAIKELTGKNYTYLPEFYFEDLQFQISDNLNNYIWLNGDQRNGNTYQVSPNSKRNYAFFKKVGEEEKLRVYLRITNRSMLYNKEIELQILALYEETFEVLENVKEQENRKYIIVTLL